ncbi:hypothetical protein BD414DRAFT_136604 [Trametes punicea]|nr:hypothetical protein BD414DRAFT_136604 [Trametes punicea]
MHPAQMPSVFYGRRCRNRAAMIACAEMKDRLRPGCGLWSRSDHGCNSRAFGMRRLHCGCVCAQWRSNGLARRQCNNSAPRWVRACIERETENRSGGRCGGLEWSGEWERRRKWPWRRRWWSPSFMTNDGLCCSVSLLRPQYWCLSLARAYTSPPGPSLSPLPSSSSLFPFPSPSPLRSSTDRSPSGVERLFLSFGAAATSVASALSGRRVSKAAFPFPS